MSTISTRPACSFPGCTQSPTFAAWNVTVTSARTHAPSTSPVEAFTPEGTSTATTGAPGIVDGRDRGVQRRARRSLEAGAEQRVDHATGALERGRQLGGVDRAPRAHPAPRGAAWFARASGLRSCGSASSSASALDADAVQQPRDDEPVAAVVALAADRPDRSRAAQAPSPPARPRRRRAPSARATARPGPRSPMRRAPASRRRCRGARARRAGRSPRRAAYPPAAAGHGGPTGRAAARSRTARGPGSDGPSRAESPRIAYLTMPGPSGRRGRLEGVGEDALDRARRQR